MINTSTAYEPNGTRIIDRFITTDYILDEAYTWFISMPRAGYAVASEFDTDVRRGTTEVRFVDKLTFEHAREVYFLYNRDKQWSFTDCTSFVVMKALKINHVFTFDTHFSQMGFQQLKA